MPPKKTPTKRTAKEELAEAAKTVEQVTETVVADIKEAAKKASEKAAPTMQAASKKVKENPWPVVAGAGLLGALIGFFAGRNRR